MPNPSAPNPYQTTTDQQRINFDAADYQTLLNRNNTNTPWGGLTWSTDPTTGQQTANVSMPENWMDLYRNSSSGANQSANVSHNSSSGSSSSGGQNQSTNQSVQGSQTTAQNTSSNQSQNTSSNQSQNTSTNQSQNTGYTTAQNSGQNTSQNTSQSGSVNQATNVAAANAQNTAVSNTVANAQNTGTSQSRQESTALDKLTTDAYGKLLPQLEAKLGQPVAPVAPMTNFGQAYGAAGRNFTNLDGSLADQGNLSANANALQGQAQQRLGNLYGQDFNYNGVQQALPTASDATRKSVEDALYTKATSRLDPQYQQTRSDLDARLAAQGITQGSEAYNRELQNLGRTQNDAYEGARNSAISMSTDEMAKQYQLQLAGRQQGVSEANKMRELPTTEALAAGALGQNAAGSFANLANIQSGQQAAAGNIANNFTRNSTEQADQEFNQGQAGIKNLLDYLGGLKAGGQSALTTSDSQNQGTSTSLGTSNAQGTSVSNASGQSTGSSFGTSQGTSQGTTQGTSQGRTQGTSSGSSQGTSSGVSQGTSSGESQGTSSGSSFGNSQGQSTGSTYGSSSNTSTGMSAGMSDGYTQSQSYNLPDFTKIGANTGGTVAPANLSNNVNQGYANQVAGANSINSGLASIASAAIPSLIKTFFPQIMSSV